MRAAAAELKTPTRVFGPTRARRCALLFASDFVRSVVAATIDGDECTAAMISSHAVSRSSAAASRGAGEGG